MARVEGNEQDNPNLNGTALADEIFGFGGNDTLRGLSGDDLLDGGAGNDTSDGGPGNDTFVWDPGGGTDTIIGGPGTNDLARVTTTDASDRLSLRPEGLQIVLDSGGTPLVQMSDVGILDIRAEGDSDFLLLLGTGGTFGDFISRGLFQITFRGGDGADLLAGARAGVVTLTGFGGEGDDFLNGGPSQDRLDGEAGDDTLAGMGGVDTLSGGPGSDRFIWGVGDGLDAIVGGTESDTLEINGADDRADEFVLRAESGAAVALQLNEITGTFQRAVFQAIAAVETLEFNGRAGDDALRVEDLSGTGLGPVIFRGGLGDDTFDGGAATLGSIAVGDDGGDTLLGGPGADIFRGDSDTASGELFSDDTLIGAGGDDRLVGDFGDDVLQGGPGNDTIEGGASGFSGDVLQGGAGNDTLDGGAGIDFIGLADASGAITFTLVQSAADTTVDLSPVGLGIDTYRNIEGVVGSPFGDTLFGSAGADTFDGLDGDDQLFGFPGADLLFGDNGRDTLDGGAGNDALEGDDDADTFVYNNFLQRGGGVGGGADTILDFTAADGDQIRLSPFPLTRGSIDSNGDNVLNAADRRVTTRDFDDDGFVDLRINLGAAASLTVNGVTQLQVGTEVIIPPLLDLPLFDIG